MYWQAPTLYDDREPIDYQLSEIGLATARPMAAAWEAKIWAMAGAICLPNLRHFHEHKCQMFWEMKDSELGNFQLHAAVQWIINFQAFISENTRYCHVQIVSQNNSCDHVV